MDDEFEHLPPLPEATAAYDLLTQVAPRLTEEILAGWAVPTLELWRSANGVTQTAQLRVKEKLATARVSVWTEAETTDAVRHRLSTLADDAEHRLEEVCFYCGRAGKPYKEFGLYQIACSGCWDLMLAWRERTRIPEEQITLADVDDLTQAALADAEYRHERVSIQLCAAVARRLVTDPNTVLSVVERNLHAKEAHTRGSANDDLDEWANLLGGGHFAEIVRTMLAPDFRGYEMRKSAPFAGVLSQEEREAAIAEAAQP